MKEIVRKLISAVPYSFDSNQVTLILKNLSGSNTFALYKFKPRDGLKIKIVWYSKSLKFIRQIIKSRVIISTHGPIVRPRGSFHIELWHGFPLKAMGLLDKGTAKKKKKIEVSRYKLIDYCVSYSGLFNVLMNACWGIKGGKYYILGAPRNDFLFKSDGRANIRKIKPEIPENSRILFYLPTFRQGYHDNPESSFSPISILRGFFNLRRLEDFLEQNNLVLVMKLHPFEELSLKVCNWRVEKPNSRVIFITNNDLLTHNMDLYEFLNAADLLITDYSSVYFDFLLLKRPAMFFAPDIQEYRENRGFLLEPFDFWAPGPKVCNQKEFEKEIVKLLSDDDYYSFQRKTIRDIVHTYKDGNSSRRVWNLVKMILTRRHKQTLSRWILLKQEEKGQNEDSGNLRHL